MEKEKTTLPASPELPRPSLSPTAERIFTLLFIHPKKLYPWEMINQSLGRSMSPQTIRAYLKRIRAALGKNLFFSLRGVGAFFLPEEANPEEVTLTTLGVSLFDSPKEGAFIENLSLLPPEFAENPLLGPFGRLVVLRAMDKLVLQRRKEGAPFFIPYLPFPLRRLLATLSRGEVCSPRELIDQLPPSRAKSPPRLLRSQIRVLREKLKRLQKGDENSQREVTIFTLPGKGWLLAERVPSLLFVYPPKPKLQPSLAEKVNILFAPPGETTLYYQHLEKGETPTAVSLLTFFLQNPFLCLAHQEVFEKIVGGKLTYHPSCQKPLLRTYFHQARAILERIQGENLHLATVDRYSVSILCRGAIGEEVELPGLYDFSRIPSSAQETISSLMARGKLKNSSLIAPNFPPTQAAILLLLAQRPNEFFSIETLQEHIWGPTPQDEQGENIRKILSLLRKRLKELDSKLTIEYQDFSYRLVVP